MKRDRRSEPDAAYWVRELGLVSHPEGGWYRETYRSPEVVAGPYLPARFGGGRVFATAIYFLLEGKDFSALHRLRSDELWHFYAGGALALHIMNGGHRRIVRLGGRPDRGEAFQALVPAGCWFGARVCDTSSYALAGCTVAPGFEFADFELGRRRDLLALYPEHADLIMELTR